MKRLLFLFLMLSATFGVRAQDSVVGSFKADLASHYLWRGLNYGGFNASVTANNGWKGLHFEVFGATLLSESNPANEIDLSLYYEWGDFSFGLNDYWFDTDNPNFFDFRPHKTGHVTEAFVGYNFGIVDVAGYTNVLGSVFNDNGNREWASYLEITSTELEWATIRWQGQIGVAPWASDYYNNRHFAVTNISLKASKEIVATDHLSVPLYLQLSTNPNNNKTYCILGITLSIVNGEL